MTNKQQMELFDLLEKQMELYTKGDSSTVSVEFAQKLLLSMEYCMNCYYKALEDGEPYGIDNTTLDANEESMEVILNQGMMLVEGCVKSSKELLKRVSNNRIRVNHITYEKTIEEEIPQFFDMYEPRFGAQIIPIVPTYPLAVKVTKLKGIEYLYEYLYRLNLENEFVQRFELRNIQLLYRIQGKRILDNGVNLFELVLQNALGLHLLDKDIFKVNVTSEECIQLHQKLSALSIAKLQILLEKTIDSLLSLVQMNHKEMLRYTKEKGKEIARRVEKSCKQNTLFQIFVDFSNDKEDAPTYFEGVKLNEEELHEVMNALHSMPYLSNKLDYVQAKIHNLDDFIQVLGNCFAGEEYEQVFALLLPSERKLLLLQAQAYANLYQDESLLKEWERLLLELEVEKEKKDESRNGI